MGPVMAGMGALMFGTIGYMIGKNYSDTYLITYTARLPLNEREFGEKD
jgi:hypothetical protein